ncbi:MAG: undecaprenyl-diphosphate phosphatase [Synergistaceae bacterium]|nr:undecaprenyl-diphosphate phosphatase [Synergistaceae bacterium]
MIKTMILGAVQGLCEFLPVSSSGHLALFQIFFGYSDNLVAFDILLHFATLLAVVIFFWRDIWEILFDWFGGWFSKGKRSGWPYGWAIIIATVVTAVIGLTLKPVVEKAAENLLLVGTGEIFTAVVLLLVPVFSRRPSNSSLLAIALAVGFAQGIAVLPGVSRSGMSIAMGLFMGLSISEAFRFSFLISIPAILGATLLEGLSWLKDSGAVFLPEGWIYGAIIAFVLGLVSLKFMKGLVDAGKWAYFGLYCLIIGAVAVLFALEVLHV